MRITIYLAIILSSLQLGCTTTQKIDKDTITIDRPVIKNLNDIDSSFKKLQHSLVRLRINNEAQQEESYGTGFFYRTKDLLVTTLHLFNSDNPCLKNMQCDINIGFAKDSKDVTEQIVQVEVVLKDQSKDLIFLKIKDSEKFENVQPLLGQVKKNKGTLTAAGFYLDNPALTFSQGKNIDDKDSNSLTSIIVSRGFSGSPIVNTKGELVGVVSSFRPIKGQQIGLAQYTPMSDADGF
jgi:S1-C subfamily serine protease